MLSKDVNIIVYSTFHTMMGPDDDSNVLPAHLLPAKHGARPRGYRQTGGRETPDAHSSDLATQGRTPKTIEAPRW